MEIRIFWDMAPCRLVSIYVSEELVMVVLEDEGMKIQVLWDMMPCI
jgi:hypothetical protein